ncbi:MAG: DUF1926 domain-containing protein [Nitrospinota bacterium]|nr:DUF1926 domain-containing protein [Nitrospinota bacterium]
MNKIYFLFGLHNHQPVGNFEHVFEEAFEKCYSPLLDTLNRFPSVRLSLHHSGPLLEWIEKNRPEYLDRMKEMVSANRVEILGGGFYEPILSSLPVRDAVGQLEMMNDWVEKHFGKRPRGAWLAERIWDPSLPEVLYRAGIEFTLLDDTHFYYAGLTENDMNGYYITEKHGFTTAIFPIDKFLRYSIPFKEPVETINYFKSSKEKHGTTAITYGDDGEKFGLWPETYDWVYTRKWLERFLETITANHDDVETIFYSEYIDRFPAKGKIYLPPASYEEMMHWTLAPKTANRYSKILEELKMENKREQYMPFLRGGLWDNFMVKYDEANILHKKMLYVSERAKKASSMLKGKARISAINAPLYRGQCNCPYWHGLFGGLYLSNLRHAVHTNLIDSLNEAGKVLHKTKTWVEVQTADYFKMKDENIIAETGDIFTVIDPSYGGSLVELDFKPSSFNLSNVLARREEEYHQKIIDSVNQKAAGEKEILSIHDRIHMKEEGLDKKLVIDRYLRRSFIDHFHDYMPTINDFWQMTTKEQSDFTKGRYGIVSASTKKEKGIIALERNGIFTTHESGHKVSVNKTFSINSKKPEIACTYTISNTGAQRLHFVFGVEWNFTLLAADAPDRYVTILGHKHLMNSEGQTDKVDEWSMTDEYFKFTAEFSAEKPVTLLRYPIETVSQSEGGFESNYQGTCFMALEWVSIAPGASLERTYTIRLKSL